MATTDSRVDESTEYNSTCERGEAVPFVQLTSDGHRETVVGDGADVSVSVDGDELTVEIEAEIEAAECLVDRDLLSVVLHGKDLPTGDR